MKTKIIENDGLFSDFLKKKPELQKKLKKPKQNKKFLLDNVANEKKLLLSSRSSIENKDVSVGMRGVVKRQLYLFLQPLVGGKSGSESAKVLKNNKNAKKTQKRYLVPFDIYKTIQRKKWCDAHTLKKNKNIKKYTSLFVKFIESHPEFRSFKSFVVGDIVIDGLIDILKKQKKTKMNPVDSYVYQEIMKNNLKDVVLTKKQIKDAYEKQTLRNQILNTENTSIPEEIQNNTIQVETNVKNRVKAILLNYQKSTIIKRKEIVEKYLSGDFDLDGGCDEKGWKLRLKQVVTDWSKIQDDFKNDKSLNTSKSSLISSTSSEVTKELSLKDQINILEKKIYKSKKKSEYFKFVNGILIALDEHHPLGKYSKFFRAKVSSNVYKITKLSKITLDHMYAEFILNNTLDKQEFSSYYNSVLESQLDSLLVNELYDVNPTMKRVFEKIPQLPASLKKSWIDLEKRCKIPLRDLLVCKSKNGSGELKCFNLNELKKLNGEKVEIEQIEKEISIKKEKEVKSKVEKSINLESDDDKIKKLAKQGILSDLVKSEKQKELALVSAFNAMFLIKMYNIEDDIDDLESDDAVESKMKLEKLKKEVGVYRKRLELVTKLIEDGVNIHTSNEHILNEIFKIEYDDLMLTYLIKIVRSEPHETIKDFNVDDILFVSKKDLYYDVVLASSKISDEKLKSDLLKKIEILHQKRKKAVFKILKPDKNKKGGKSKNDQFVFEDDDE